MWAGREVGRPRRAERMGRMGVGGTRAKDWLLWTSEGRV